MSAVDVPVSVLSVVAKSDCKVVMSVAFEVIEPSADVTLTSRFDTALAFAVVSVSSSKIEASKATMSLA